MRSCLKPEGGRDVVEIGHVAHVDPGLRHGDDHIGEAEAELVDEHDLPIGIEDHLAHQVFAGDAELHRALAELRGDFRRREVGDLDAVKAGDGAAIVACAARFDEFEPGTGEERFHVFLQASLRRHGENKGGAHAAAPQADNSSIEAANPTAGICSCAPSRVSKPS